METYKLTVNGQHKEVTADPGTPLLWVLREDLKMTGTKYGCGISACGACTVHVAGVATRSCMLPVSLVGDRPVVTIEGIGRDTVGRADQDCGRAPQAHDQTDGRQHRGVNGREHLPLRHLRPHPRSHQNRRATALG